MRISDWISDVCSSDLIRDIEPAFRINGRNRHVDRPSFKSHENPQGATEHCCQAGADNEGRRVGFRVFEFLRVSFALFRSEEHTSELQSLMRTSYAVFCLQKKKIITQPHNTPRDPEHNQFQLSRKQI